MTRTPFTLLRTSYDWAINHLISEGDTDLLPPLFELEAIKYNWTNLIDKLQNLDLSQHKWQDGRRFIVPKDQLAFRIATQLAPLDNLFLAAIIKQFGEKIELGRIPVTENRVFSYRFDPTSQIRFYEETTSWRSFWENSYIKASKEEINWIVITDITDFYNQIYHHTLENELKGVGIQEEAINCILSLITRLTQTVSRGIPVGPHSIHLLAELALNPIDRSLLSHNIDFCRYVDDMHVFCKTEQDARIAVYDLAKILDTQQRLILNKQKTQILSKTDFLAYAQIMMEDIPNEENEKNLLKIVDKYSSSNRYAQFNFKELSETEKETLNSSKLEQLFNFYLTGNDITVPVANYARIRWLLRRLSQFGAPGAIIYCLTHIDQLTPALGDVANYIIKASKNYSGDLKNAGDLALKALENPVVMHNDYLQLTILNLFSKIPGFNHVNVLTSRYEDAPSGIKREILLAVKNSEARAWIKERKEDFGGADPWLKTAILSAIKELPGDEGFHWVRGLVPDMTPTEKIIAKWTFNNTEIFGEIFLLGIEEERFRADQEAKRADKEKREKEFQLAERQKAELKAAKAQHRIEELEEELEKIRNPNQFETDLEDIPF